MIKRAGNPGHDRPPPLPPKPPRSSPQSGKVCADQKSDHNYQIPQYRPHDYHNVDVIRTTRRSRVVANAVAPPATSASEELLVVRHSGRSNSANDLQRPRPHTHGHDAGGEGGNMGGASSAGNVSDGLLATACRNVSLSNRSLVRSVVKERERASKEDVTLRRNRSLRGGAKGDPTASLDQQTVAQRVTLQPESSRECPVYVIEAPPSRPSLLQRSKTFILGRAQSVRRSVRARANSASSKAAKTNKDADAPRGISLVFENKLRDDPQAAKGCAKAPKDENGNENKNKATDERKGLLRRSSFKIFRKRF